MKKIAICFGMLFMMLASFKVVTQGFYGDVNGDGVVNISDVNAVIGVILSDNVPTPPPPPVDEHEWVDLGLPSGTLWATMNVGASSPNDCWEYFAWGEITSKRVYNWNTYKWCNGDWDSLTKYNVRDGRADGKTELEPQDDPAYVNWGPSWRTPTREQLKELAEKCTWKWTTINAVHGYQVTGPNGNTMFLPAAGICSGKMLLPTGEGYYWSRTLYTETEPDSQGNNSLDSYNLYFRSGLVSGESHFGRTLGFSVRAVRVPQ